MRIAYLSHFFPPDPCGGAGYYTASLAEGIQARGHTVGVLCVEQKQWGASGHYLNGWRDDRYNAVPVRRLRVNWRKGKRPFDYLYDSPVLARQVQAFLDEFEPDLVHVSSTYTLSSRSVLVAKETGVPVVMHLHDYWTICSRLSLLHKNGTICTGPDSPSKCQKCTLANSRPEKLASLFLSDAAQKRLWTGLQKSSWFTRQPGLIGMLGDFERRRQFVLSSTAAADLLVVPTRFARDVLVAGGVRPDTMAVIPYGMNTSWVEKVRWIPSDELRVVFLGNVIPKKGVHILADAFGLLRARGYPLTLDIWGNMTLERPYCQSLMASAHSEIHWHGSYTRNDLPSILSNADVVVAPSIWYETQGIIIQEAFAAGVPVVVSAGTSMTETVRDNVDGLYFEMGSVEELAAKLTRLNEESGLLPRLRSNIPSVRSIDEDIDLYIELYTELASKHKRRHQT